MQRYTLTFRKGEGARFLSHLDLTAVFEYAVRRARLPVALSEGFNPRPRLSVAASLALGYVGEAEILEVTLREQLAAEDVRVRLQAVLPPGIELTAARAAEPGAGTAASRLHSAIYRIALPAPVERLAERVEELLQTPRLEVEEQRDEGIRRRDLRPMLLALEVVDSCLLRLTARMDGEGSVRPEQILTLLRITPAGARITRERIVLTG